MSVSEERLRVDVLGPIRARDAGGADVTPDGALQRRLLALLVLRRGHVVSVDAAIDALWPSRPPREPVAALHNHVFRLRRHLPVDVIESTGTGYRLVPSRIDLDVDRLAAALGAPPGDAAAQATIDAVLAGWHGAAFPELDDVDEARAETVRLADLRVRAIEARAEARLAAGATDGLVAELAALAADAPLRERPRALLMAALAAEGRAVEALRVYDDFRRLLGDELGTAPSPALAAQHAELLDGAGPATTPGSAWRPASRLPVPVTSLVGREALLADLVATTDAHRLVTLVGPGGVGKTRLLVEIGQCRRAARPDRPVVLVELATATSESAVDVVAAALAIDGRPGIGLTERVLAVLCDTELVLLLDNCEHVLDPIAELVEGVLATCPHVSVVATSRERLRVPGEQLRTVPPLGGGASDSPAVRLFVERAQAVAPDFDPGPEQQAVIGEIVRHLDGLPLAIELAAARLHTLDVTEVASGLDQRFALLTTGSRTTPRHGSLGAAMAWSFGLLDADAQRFFTDLSVFAGSFSVSDAAAVTALTDHAVADALDQLVERSLVLRAPGHRYVLLETLRAFAADRLAAQGRAAVTAERHARHQVAWIEAADRRLTEPGGIVEEIDGALVELRSALGWLLEHDDVERAGRLMIALLDYGILRLRPDVLAWARRVAEADADDRLPTTSRVWAVSGYARWMAGDVVGSAADAARARRASPPGGDGIASEVATITANHELFQGRLGAAVRWYERAHRAAVDAGDHVQETFVRATMLLALGYARSPRAAPAAAALLADVGDAPTVHAAYVWFCAGESDLALDVDRARTRLTRAVQLGEASGALFVTGLAGASLASIDARRGDPGVAAEDYRRLITHWRRAGMWPTQWTMLRSVAVLLARLGRPRDAAVLVGAVRATSAGHRIFGADQATLAELEARLRDELGDDEYAAAALAGAALDGDQAVEHALRSL